MPVLLKQYVTYLKIAVILIYTTFIWHCHTIYDNSKLAATEHKQIISAQTGQNNLVKYHEQLSKEYAKENSPCLTTPIPTRIRRLLH